jgi:hypothetical protein
MLPLPLNPAPVNEPKGASIEIVEGSTSENASIASHAGGGRPTAGCSAFFQIEATGEEELKFGAELRCEEKKPHLEFEACLYKKFENGPWEQEWCANGGNPAYAKDAHGLSTGEVSGGCADGFEYTGWVWGFIWGSGITSQAFGGLPPDMTGAYVTCEGQKYDHEL